MADIIPKNIGKIYLVLPFIKKLKIGETINRYVEDAGDIDIGTIIEILILNYLCGFSTPLYGMARWGKEHGIDEIYGIDAEKLTDDRIGRVLDKIFLKIGTLDSQVTVNLLSEFDVDVSKVHFDPSSYEVKGKPCARAGDPKSIEVVNGRNGKGEIRRQVRFGVLTTDKGNVVLAGKAYSGNTSDSEMHPEFLEQLREIIKSSNFLWVADSKFDTLANLLNIFRHGGSFLCPGVFSEERKEEFLARLERGEIKWEVLEYVAKADKKKAKCKRPYYKAYEIKVVIKNKAKDGTEEEYEYRLIYVYSSKKAKQQEKTRTKQIYRIKSRLDKIKRQLNKGNYKEREHIEKKIGEALNLNAMGKIFNYRLVKRNGLFQLDYSLDDSELQKLEKLDGVYLLKTNLDESHSIDDVMQIYKRQGQIEERIKTIKGPLSVAPNFLRDPKRIASLVFVVIQALKVYSIIEYETRKAIEDYGKPIPILPEGRKTSTPSGETILRLFDNSVSILIGHDSQGNKIRRITKPNKVQLLIFRILYIKPPDLRSLSRKFGKRKGRNHAPP